MTHSLAPASESCFSLAPLPGSASAALSHPSCESYKIHSKIKTNPKKNLSPLTKWVRKGTLLSKLATARETKPFRWPYGARARGHSLMVMLIFAVTNRAGNLLDWNMAAANSRGLRKTNKQDGQNFQMRKQSKVS
uniref:(northern house mosquito) hypothetical protein n=1 Tax=Culex pipiens TaxID=7175 RepID=A0A8D8ICS1_CULPI